MTKLVGLFHTVIMKLTTKGRYAVTAMLDIALNAHKGPVALAAIANRQDLSTAYLEQLFAKLKRAGLVESVRGPGGGYLLAQAPLAITVAAVIDAVDERVDATRCKGESTGCQGGLTCLTHGLWQDLSDQIHSFLNGVNLAELMQRQSVTEVAYRQQEFALAAQNQTTKPMNTAKLSNIQVTTLRN